MNKILMVGLGVIVLLVGGFFLLNSYIYNEKQASVADKYTDAEYIIEGERIQFKDGIAETETAPGSASKTVTRYFGNEVMADLNDDGREDVVFLLTQQTGGSGTFYYVVAALNTERGYVGSEALLLGDRIAPQTTELSKNPIHKNVIVVNYADRAPGEPMTAQPSVGKSIWIKLDIQSMQFGVVEQNFEGEADPLSMSLGMKTWTWVSALYNGKEIRPGTPGTFSISFDNDGGFSARTDCNSMGGGYTAGEKAISFSHIVSTKMYCEGSQEAEFASLLESAQAYRFTSRGELIFDLMSGGSAVFK